LELIDAIRGRRSIRSFKDKPVPLELVREVLDSANYAPSAKRGEQWRFTVLTGDAKARFLGFFDMAAYEAYLGGGLKPFELPDERIRETVGKLKRLYPFA